MNKNSKQGILIIVAIVAGTGALFLGIIGWQQYTLFTLGKETPQRISLAKLAAQGPGDNIHLEITDFQLATDFTYESNDDGSWSRVWIAMEPLGSRPDSPVRVLLRSDTVKDQNALSSLEKLQPLHGILVNSIHGLGGGISKELRELYRGIDLDNVLVFAHDWSYPKANAAYGYLALTAFCILLSIVASYGAYLVSLQPDYASTMEAPKPVF